MNDSLKDNLCRITTMTVMILIAAIVLAVMGVKTPGITEAHAADPAQPSNVKVSEPESESGLEYPEGMTVPKISYLTGTTGVGTASLSASMSYDYNATKYGFRIYVKGKLVHTTTANYLTSYTITIPYAGKTTIKVVPYQVYKGVTYTGTAKSIKKTSKKMSKPKVRPVRLGNSKAIVSWSQVTGATGYEVYMGKKKVKTLKSSKSSAIISKKKAGKAKFSIAAVRKSEGKKYRVKGKAVKAKKNVHKFNNSLKVKSYDYWTCPYIIRKIELKGKTYVVTGYACNNRMWKMEKYKKLNVTVRSGGKVVAKKTFKNKKVNVKAYGKKKIVLKIKGKPNKDLVNSCGWETSRKEYWEHGY